jgi:hypothetical protein
MKIEKRHGDYLFCEPLVWEYCPNNSSAKTCAVLRAAKAAYAVNQTLQSGQGHTDQP